LLQERGAKYGKRSPGDIDASLFDGAEASSLVPKTLESLISTLQSLIKLFSQKRDVLLDALDESKRDFQEENAALQTVAKEASESQESEKGEQAEKEETLATASADLRKSKSSATEVETLVNATEKSCAEEDSAALTRNALRQQEIDAVTEALSFLKKALPNATQNETSLLQNRYDISQQPRGIGSQTMPAFQHKNSQSKLLGFLRREASQLKSRALGRLVASATQAMRSQASGDDFGMVKSMIEQLIEQLLQQQAEGLQQKAFCDEELAKNKHTHTSAEREMQEATADVGQLEASMAHLEQELNEASEELSALQSELSTRTEARANASAANADEADDAEAAASAIKAAQEVLKEHQANVSKANDGKTKGMDGVGTVVALLEHVEEQYVAMGADSKKAEAAEVESHKVWTTEANSTIAALAMK
jgi:chromosome segregation ATPase